MINSKEASNICVSCQLCCKSVGLYSASPYTEENKEFYEARGAEVTKRNIDDFEYMFLSFNFPCPNLDPVKGCLIYDHRPAVCKTYPEEGSPLLNGCELHLKGFI
jgi:Fe-S-cluster containining protein